MDQENGAFLTIFLINWQSNCSMNDTNIMWCGIPYQRSHRCSFPFGSIWGLSSLLIIAIIIRTWKERNKCCTIAKEKPWSRSICIRHLVPRDVQTRYQGALWLDGTDWKAGTLLLLKASGPSPPPQPLHALSHSVGGTRGQSTLLVVIVEETSTVGFSSREKGHSKSLKII